MGKGTKSRVVRVAEQQRRNTDQRTAFHEIAVQSGVIERVVRLLSANYLLHSQSAVLLSDIEETLANNGLSGGRLVSKAKKMNDAFNDYFDTFSKLIAKEQVQNWADDLTKFGGVFQQFAGIETEFTPDYDKVDITEINEKYHTNIEIDGESGRVFQNRGDEKV